MNMGNTTGKNGKEFVMRKNVLQKMTVAARARLASIRNRPWW